MATRKKKPTKYTRDLMESLMFGRGRTRRFTQDSPVLPDVWFQYAGAAGADGVGLQSEKDPKAFKLLLTPHRNLPTGEVQRVLRERVRAARNAKAGSTMPRIIYNQSTVAAELTFEELVTIVIPMTEWWNTLAGKFLIGDLQKKPVQERLARAASDPEHPDLSKEDRQIVARLPDEVLWLIRVVGAIELLRRGKPLPKDFDVGGAGAADWLPVVKAVAGLLKSVDPNPGTSYIHSISLNRPAYLTIFESARSVKADAALRLFEIDCSGLGWAIIDSGVDGKHQAFLDRDPALKGKKRSRVVDTYDFSEIEKLLDPDSDDQPQRIKKKRKELDEQLATLNTALLTGRTIDWSLIAPLLRVSPDDETYEPAKDHGTHVAGILGGHWPKEDSNGVLEKDLVGICPDIKIYDLRVIGKDGAGNEFTVMAAMQFVRWLNSTNDYVAVHGVNLSLSIPHDVSNYACGRTPVCEEAERLVASGVVVVAAAGNQGYRRYTTPDGATTEAYNTISITDPGNAAAVITVGATHRARPHTYGVSYFSSRGPTGDGRKKPDLVAPGEKITAPLPGDIIGVKDGTSMAAPHVSGAAALLMARHNELVGQPVRIKEILIESATDLGREHYFQGAGMLDVLRALQSI